MRKKRQEKDLDRDQYIINSRVPRDGKERRIVVSIIPSGGMMRERVIGWGTWCMEVINRALDGHN